jgi:phospholipase/lecithinase/hemolysin
MKFMLRVATGITVCVLAVASAVAAPSYNKLYAFGDSYSDIGAGYLDGNGPTAVAYLAQQMGVPVTHSKDPTASGKSIVFAVSGAESGRAAGEKIETVTLSIGLINQIEDFGARVKRGELKFDPERTLFFVAIGLNDDKIPTATTVQNVTQAVTMLKAAGARHVTMSLLPTKIPDFAAVGKRLNPAYNQLAPRLMKDLSIDVSLNRWGPYFDEIIDNPAKYGIADTKNACSGRALFGEDATPCKSPDSYFYFHSSHPSTAVHKKVADMLYREIMAEGRMSGGMKPAKAN